MYSHHALSICSCFSPVQEYERDVLVKKQRIVNMSIIYLFATKKYLSCNRGEVLTMGRKLLDQAYIESTVVSFMKRLCHL